MAPLLGLESFPGEWISATRAGASWVGEAWFDGVVVFTRWDRAAVTGLLPSGWQLAANASALASDHPVVFLLGRQRTTSVLYAGTRLPTDADYDEAVVAVPFTRHRAGRLLHTVIPLMYTGDARATWSGNAHYGFGKRRGAIDRFGRSVVVTDERGALVMHVTVAAGDSWSAAGDAAVARPVAALRALGEMPVVGRRADGRDIVSYFDWSFGEADVRSAGVRLAVDAERSLGLSPSACRPEIHGVEVRRLRWRLSWPEACRR